MKRQNKTISILVIFILTLISTLIISCSFVQNQESRQQSDITIGFIGCSNTRETVEGYEHLGGNKMWDSKRRYGSGTILDWSQDIDEESKYWRVFDELLKEYPNTKMIWWELCIMDEDKTTSYEHATVVLNQIRKRIPNVVIYVSPLPPYTEGVCTITGTWGLEKSKELAQKLDEKNQDVLAGPILGPMTPTDTADDGCHLSSPNGKRKLGNQLRLFFDAPEYSKNDASIGFLGCSNTRQTVQGYDLANGKKLWNVELNEIHEYDGGAVLNWAKTDERGYEELWEVFDQYLLENPNTNEVWWQLCIRKQETEMTYQEVLPILNSLRERIPTVKIYVSALPDFPQHTCAITGKEGIQRAKKLVQELDEKNEDITAGPIIGPLYPSDMEPDDETQCHPHVEGAVMTGRQLRKFFDGIDENSDPSPEKDSKEEEEEQNVEDEAAQDDVEDEQDEPESDEELSEEKLSIEDAHWNRVFAKAFENISCPTPRNISALPAQYYKGPMFDSHIHMQSLPDGEPGQPLDEYEGENIGTKRSISQWICMLNYEGTKGAFVFFPVWEPIIPESLELVKQTMEKYPGRFIPFIMPPHDDGAQDGFPTVDATELKRMLEIEPNLFRGFGEIGLYERPDGAPALPPDSKRLQEIYPIIRQNKLLVYFHLGENQKEAFMRIAKANHDITFIFHGDQFIDCSNCDGTHRQIAEILEQNPNVYYGIDELYGGEWLLQPGKSKEEFLDHFQDYGPLLKADLAKFEEFIETHPNQVLWGTDRGVSTPWELDPDVALTLNNYSRAFIGKLDQNVQEKLAYKNAKKIFG